MVEQVVGKHSIHLVGLRPLWHEPLLDARAAIPGRNGRTV